LKVLFAQTCKRLQSKTSQRPLILSKTGVFFSVLEGLAGTMSHTDALELFLQGATI
jgi:hypothetical protein